MEFNNTSLTTHSFWQSINILITKFNVINKRLWGSKILHHYFCEPPNSAWIAPLKSINKLSEGSEKFLGRIICTDLELTHSLTQSDNIEIFLLELLPKKFSEVKAFQLVCLDKKNLTATFYNITPDNKEKNCNLCPNFTYSLSLENDNLMLKTNPDSSAKSLKWLVDTVIPQFLKWGRNGAEQKQTLFKESLQLISADNYYIKYNELKQKYGQEMVKNWSEGTDPSKYVYEDIAIATYLLMLWDSDKATCPKKTFVDLGCGNGLLVYILIKEGHNGVGIDVRKRKIWDMYPREINLVEKTIIPSNNNTFPDADWLIGNHSDELTPWIPVIAAKSSYKCNFFLLPCCAFNFDGTKYQRKDSSKSQYMEYIDYVKTICENCGFKTCIDRLKIPSTKRICLVGQKKLYPKEKYPEVCINIQNLIQKDFSLSHDNNTSWVLNFQPRNHVERVRNCTQIDHTVTEKIVDCVAKYLLEGCDLETKWTIGKEVKIYELITLLTEDNLKAMKAECGGLQTLLKNNHHIFKVDNGKVQMRYPRTIKEVYENNKSNQSKIKVQIKPCWFFRNHPKGCPLTNTTCSYMHT
ncbi:hypothetical protein evm_006782 [Chilo suppressalis]|nr:hypothetical protein evm_006782 [Chilo suppressalis]